MRTASVEVFVLGHLDETLAALPSVPGLTPLNLHSLSVDFAHDARYADTRFLLSPEARATDADFVGICSAHYDRKWPSAPHLADLPYLGRQLPPAHAIGVELATLDEWRASADYNHPGMLEVLDRLADTFRLELHPHRVPGCNIFVCSRDDWFAYLDTFQTLLTATLDWYGTDVPFGYRCPDCRTVSDTGFGRWTKARHMGYMGERITRMIFATRPDLTFWTPAEFEGSSAVRSFTARVRRKARSLTSGRGADARNRATPWHSSTHGLNSEQAADFSVCPVCADAERSAPLTIADEVTQ
jgi:hypothetical protein